MLVGDVAAVEAFVFHVDIFEVLFSDTGAVAVDHADVVLGGVELVDGGPVGVTGPDGEGDDVGVFGVVCDGGIGFLLGVE